MADTANSAASKNSNGLIWLLAATCFVLGSSQQYIMGVPDQVATSLGIELSQVSLLMTTFGLVNAFFAPVVVVVTARFPQRTQLMISLVLIAAGVVITAFANSFALQLVARGIMGMGNGSFVATAYAASQKLAEPGKQASAMANVALGFSASSVLAMPIARALRDVIMWQNAYLVLACFAAVALVVIAKKFPAAAPEGESLTLKQRLQPLTNPTLLLAYAATSFMFLGYASFYTYITPFIDDVVPQLSNYTSLILFAMGLMTLIGTKACGLLADRAGLRVALMVSLIGQTCGYVLVFFAEGAGVGLVAALCLYQLISWTFVPVQNSLLAEIAGDGARMAIALSSSFLQLGNAIGAAIAGGAITLLPYGSLPLLAIPFLMVSVLLEASVFVRAKKKRAA